MACIVRCQQRLLLALVLSLDSICCLIFSSSSSSSSSLINCLFWFFFFLPPWLSKVIYNLRWTLQTYKHFIEGNRTAILWESNETAPINLFPPQQVSFSFFFSFFFQRKEGGLTYRLAIITIKWKFQRIIIQPPHQSHLSKREYPITDNWNQDNRNNDTPTRPIFIFLS